ncbi:hypothetical protein F4802DRAFT_428043 [Xylaria palmicola]|nr:hypothetical protein F4802DRAFT_428043 [Xylaria palmicola]
MHSIKILLSIAALAGTSLAQKSDDQFCSAFFTSLVSIIEAEAPKTPPAILSFLARSTETAAPPPTTTTTTSAAPAPPLTSLDFASHARELCGLATELPPSLLPAFETYAGSLLSFGRARSAEHVAYVTDCAPVGEVASRTSYLDFIFTATSDFCADQQTQTQTQMATPTPGGGGGGSNGNGTYPAATGSGTGSGSYPGIDGSGTLIPTAAAARPTGACFLGAAAVVGGVLGAAAIL